jgi:succinate dehydrogenase/fumarate reductase flavoprotein subunit
MRIVAGIEALDVVVHDGRARGVDVRDAGSGGRTRVDADAVVLAAGTV